MKFSRILTAVLAATLCGCAEPEAKFLSGDAMHLDPLFNYYKNRSPQSVASELAANNVPAVYYFAVTPDACDPDLINALHNAGIEVILTAFPCWVYLSEADMDKYLPPNWRDWQMRFTNEEAKGEHIFISFVYPEYNQWYANYISDLINKYDFDGVALVETMYPCYDGFRYDVPLFGDVSDGFAAAFGESVPNFTDPASPDYYRTNTAKMERFLEFRTQSICDFYSFITNEIRKNCPNVKIVSWALGISEDGGLEKIRYYNGSDTYRLVAAVQPDVHVVQTHWPDWCNPDLPVDYTLKYQPFVDAARAAYPGVKVGYQGDLGSLPEMRRSPEWVNTNRELSSRIMDNSVYYEFCIRDEVYSLPPELKDIEVNGKEVTLIFDQRIAPESAAVFAGNNPGAGQVSTDGNLLKATFEELPERVDISGVCDDPEVRLALSQHEPKPYGRINTIAEGVTAPLPKK